jgi:hypothetical protein
MNSLLNNEEFCRDAFGDILPGDKRNDVVAQMVRARKGARVAEVAKAVCAVAAIVLLCVMIFGPKRSLPARPTAVAVTPVTPAVSWKIRSVAFDEIVRSEPLSELMVVRSSESNVAMVRSEKRGLYEEISDEQMLAMLQGWSVALVKVNGVSDLELMAR